MCGYVRLGLAMFGHIRLCVVPPGYVWPCLAMFGYVRLCLAMFIFVWLCLAMCGYVWLCVAMCGAPITHRRSDRRRILGTYLEQRESAIHVHAHRVVALYADVVACGHEELAARLATNI